MTGAQEQALTRLKKKHPKMTMATPKRGQGDVKVSWSEKTDWGDRITEGVVTPEGRFVESLR